MVYDLAADLFGHLQRLSVRFHSSRRIGDMIRRVTSDCGCVSQIIKDALLPVVSSLVSLLAMFLVMWRMDWGLTLVALSVIPFMLLALRLYAKPMLERSYRQQEVEGEIYNVVDQSLSSIPIVQAFDRQSESEQRFRQTADAAVAAALSTTSVQLQFKVFIGLSTALGTAGILWLGATRTLEGHLTVGGIIVFLSYLASLYAPLEALAYAPSNVQYASGSARRVLEILETEHDVQDRPGALHLARSRGHVALEEVVFGYESGRAVLKGVSLEILPGQTLAIVGGTGAGKTTLAALVPRLFDPWSGCVRIDGYDVKEVALKSLREQISLVLQEPFLFPITISSNIAYGRPHATAEQIEAAARAANAHDFIMRLPDGYQTLVGERGATLSGGERQRLSIARALLKDPPILILDEPTSSLDAQTESEMLAAMRRLMDGRTTLMIAHRLSTVRDADKIVVLDHGVIAEQGTHQQLIELGGRYASYHRTIAEHPERQPVEAAP
jgi:ATP-binding cassette subfamily B protein/subfamily B ATP-binding cassette protein MsbA